MKHSGGGPRLVVLTVLAVGCCAVPAFSKQDPQPANTPPGQVKKQDPAAQQAAPQAAAPAPAPASAPAPQQAPVTDKHAAKQQAKAEHKVTKQQAKASVTQQLSRQAQTTATQPSKQQAKATSQAAKQQAKAEQKPAAAQAQTQTNPSRAPSKNTATATPAASAPAAPAAPAATATPPVTSNGSFTAAKKTRKARKHRATRNRAVRQATTSAPATPVARISPTPVSSSNPAATTTAGKGSSGGYVPQKPTTHDDSPNVVFRTVRDAVDVVPTAIWILLGLLTALASLFAVTSARQTRRAQRLAAERGMLLGDVGVLQEAVLPIVPPRVGALALSVAHRPAGGPAAGGDFYDVIPLDNGRTALVVGDVSGHGSAALGHATLVRFTLRAHLESGAGPRQALAIAAESLAPHFEEGFATAAVALHDPEAGTLTYATAAHEAPIIVGPGAHEPVLVASTPPLGIGAGGPSARRQTTVPFPEQSLACMLTDGALEARVRGELVGRARVQEWVRELGERPAAGDMAELIRSRAAVSDDLAVCFATSTAGEDSGNWRVEELHRPTPEEAERFLDACGASEEHKRAAAEALRFTREGHVLTVRFENGAVVSAEVQRNGTPRPVAA